MLTEASAPIRILIVEDNLLTRLGVMTFLETKPEFVIVGIAANGTEALRLVANDPVDVVLVDLRMPQMDGIELTRALCATTPKPRVLILTHYQGEEDVFSALRAGAMGFLSKESPGEVLTEAIRVVARGKRYLPPELAARFEERAQRPSLTEREKEVLLMLFRGLTNRQVGEVLDISHKTVANHVANILEKLEAQSRTEAVTIALERGLVQHDG